MFSSPGSLGLFYTHMPSIRMKGHLRGVSIESDEGRRAIMIAVNLLSPRNVPDVNPELQAQLKPHV